MANLLSLKELGTLANKPSSSFIAASFDNMYVFLVYICQRLAIN